MGFEVRLAPAWREFCVPLQWQGRRLYLAGRQNPKMVEVAMASGDPLKVALDSDRPRLLKANGVLRQPEGAREAK